MMFQRSFVSVRRIAASRIACAPVSSLNFPLPTPGDASSSHSSSSSAAADQAAQLRRVRGLLGLGGVARAPRYGSALTSVRWNSSVSGGAASGAATGGSEASGAVAEALAAASNTATEAATGAAAEIVSKAAELGMNPVDIVIMALNQMQTTLGIPYWETIMIFTVALRLCLLPVAIKGVVNANRMAFLRPDMERLQEAMKASQALGDMKVQQRYQMEMKGLFEKHKVNPMRALVLPFLQMPIFVSVFMALRQVQDYFPAYCSGGALWFTDLSVSDPYYILPVINAATFLLMIETGADGMDQQMKGTFKNVMRLLGVAMVPLTAAMPQGLFMYWCTNNILSLIQARAMKSSALKKAFDLKDPPVSAKVDRESAFKKISAAMTEFGEQMKKEREGRVEIITGSSNDSVSPAVPPPPPSNGSPATTTSTSSSTSSSSSGNAAVGAPPKTFAYNPKQAKKNNK